MTNEGSRIAWPLRAWLGIEILFGLAAMATIALTPADTARHFAWPIKPTVTAALLGAFYMSSAWVFVLAALAKRWESIRVMMIPAILFTFTELLATFVHWDRFAVGTMPFNVWFASYLLPPPILAACYWWQQRRAVPKSDDTPLARSVRSALVLIGTVLTIEGTLAFIWPKILIDTAPWTLTPLTARAICGWLIALGTMMLSVAYENDRDRARVVAPFFILLLPAVYWQLTRFSSEVNWSHGRIIVNLVVLVIICAIGVYLAMRGRRNEFRR
jgi:hypothetical protein